MGWSVEAPVKTTFDMNMKRLLIAFLGIFVLSTTYVHSMGRALGAIEESYSDLMAQTKVLYGGMNYVVVDKKTSFESQLAKPNTIYEICYDIDLKGKKIVIPAGSELRFSGGSLSNGIIEGQETRITATPMRIFDTSLSLTGSWDIVEAYPEWYGANGDGLVDDTKAVRAAVVNFNQLLIPIKINRPFRITQSIINRNVLAGKKSIYLILHGRHSQTYRSIQKVGGLLLDKGVDLFDGTTTLDVGGNYGRTFIGELKNLVISTESITAENSPLTGSVFINSEIRGFLVDGCYVMSMGSFLKDTESEACTKIRDNTFLFIHSFAAFTDGTRHGHFVDSILEGNYISGGGHNDLSTNDCMEFSTYNGSTIINNFIDHYRCVYNPKFKSAHGEVVSIANHYQVFRYLYNGDRFSWVFSSTSDVINWTANAESLPEMKPLKDSKNRVIPPCVVWFGESSSNNVITFVNLTFQNNIEKKFLFLQRDLFRNNDKLIVSPISFDNSLSGVEDWDFVNFGDDYVIIAGRTNNSHPVVDIDIVSKMTKLPVASGSHAVKAFVGQRVEIDGIRYEAKMDLFENRSNSKTVIAGLRWNRLGEPDYGARQEVNSNVKTQYLQIGTPYFNTTYNTNGYWNGTRFLDSRGNSIAGRSGRTTQRPTASSLDAAYDIGYEYFDTDLGKPIYVSAINAKTGVVSWVDAMGNKVQ